MNPWQRIVSFVMASEEHGASIPGAFVSLLDLKDATRNGVRRRDQVGLWVFVAVISFPTTGFVAGCRWLKASGGRVISRHLGLHC